ncbi:Rz1-like lysis system protein LysC [Parasedimentitalea psychrophila]|uniref:Uncharacterized protein n=1 Tax=Parasedimentitalea psychrophila TaxID=2997337 RepID=A0A9Y2KXT0_9RHOB|nr:hypothetical protein [Parasedimentitalea psychrophila]WIY25106.1 hypothetical protein QPJ95_21885 [Parasedimentitalea psychrophila]
MRLYLLCCALLLSACGPDPIVVTAPPPQVPADLLRGCAGWTGPVPNTEGQLSDALVAELRGRHCANGRIVSIAEILNPSGPR